MSQIRKFVQVIFSSIIVLSLGLSVNQPQSAAAQRGDGVKRQVNAQNGKVSFLGPESGSSVPASRALGISTFARPADPAMALAKRFAPEFGLQTPERDLAVKEASQSDQGRVTVRYQQNYQGIPVMGGELMVNTNENGDLYSMNGEVSSDLSLSIEPTIDSERATQTALQAVAKWYQKTPADFTASEPELWIFDESLLLPSSRPVELVWRMEVTSVDSSIPVRELVLVNAERGHISLHFNQTDTAWHSSGNANTVQTSEITVPTSSSTNSESYRDTNDATRNDPHALVVTTWYVATTGNDSNSCSAVASPCLTINGAIGKAANGDTIKIETGTYTSTDWTVVHIDRSLNFMGGWNATFTSQTGMSTIDGQTARMGVFINQPNPLVTASLDRFIIKNSKGGGNGAGVFNGGNLTITNSSIRDNTALPSSGEGGGISNYGSLTLTNTTVSNNSASYGGAIDNDSGHSLILNNVTISNNSATYGGGIYGFGWEAGSTLNNVTITGNTAQYGGGIAGFDGTITLRNSIVARNIATPLYPQYSYPDCYGTVGSSGYNLIGNNSGCTFNATTGDLVGTSSSTINAKLTPLQDNGGLTLTHALMVGSPAINAGNPATPGSGGSTCLSTDQRGIARPIGGRCDIGAYEGSVSWASSPSVNTYTANDDSSLPGFLLCNETDPNCASGDAHAKAAHKYAIGTYNFYATQHARDSIDDNGMTIISSVHYNTVHCIPACPYYNAFWDGTQIAYGDGYGFPLADDVVAHEYTHGVTQYESNLFYYYQSGAINESFSDLWGEYYDQSNGLGNDTAGVKWLHGEDISGLGAHRSMSDPTIYGDSDKMTSANYFTGEDDNGGVHYNSGINNKAAYLMVDGGTFNGKTVTALGWAKTISIYYEAQTNILISGSDYSDLYYALQQACTNLTGQYGITAANCTEVKDAIDAVEMNAQPTSNFNTDAPYCHTGSPTFSFTDNLETGTGNWTFANGAYTRWQYDTPDPFGPYAHSGAHSLYADDYPDDIADASARLVSLSVPSNAYLHFAHAYGFETDLSNNYDGGVIEYSTNGGSTWLDAAPLINFNGYDGPIFTGAGNPLSGRLAFTGSSHGYISTRLNLTSLAGQTVTFRWRMGLDQALAAWGWWVDDVRLYTCPSPFPANVSVQIAGTDMGNYVLQPYTSTRPSYAGIDSGPVKVETTNGVPIVAALQDLWSDGGNPSSSIQLMGLPENQLSDTYWFPAYNNVSLNDQIRFGNVGTSPTVVTVTIGGVVRGTYGLNPSQSIRVNYAGVDSGPVKVKSSGGVKIIASIRDSWHDGTKWSSYAQLMGLPNSQLSDTYLFPAYNNVSLDDQLRFGNVGTSPTTVTVTIGGVVRGTYGLNPNQSIRVNYPGLDSGPVKVQSSGGVKIIASIRDAWFDGTKWTSYFQLMGLPFSQLSDTYLFPAYDNVSLDGQLRFANVGTAATTVTVTINGIVQGTYSVGPSQSVRVNYAGLDSGPVKIQSSGGVKIIASLRDSWFDGSSWTSYAQLMGLPAGQLSSVYLFPAYNNVTYDNQLRVGFP